MNKFHIVQDKREEFCAIFKTEKDIKKSTLISNPSHNQVYLYQTKVTYLLIKIKSFYGTTRNAVYSQIWIVICTYLLIAIAKKRMRIEQSLYTFSQTLGLTLFEKMPINEIFNKTATEQFRMFILCYSVSAIFNGTLVKK